jgi:hypothetical protein
MPRASASRLLCRDREARVQVKAVEARLQWAKRSLHPAAFAVMAEPRQRREKTRGRHDVAKTRMVAGFGPEDGSVACLVKWNSPTDNRAFVDLVTRRPKMRE